MQDTVIAVINPNPQPSLLSLGQNPCIGTPFDLCLDDSHTGSESWTVAWSSYPDMDAAGGCEGLCCSLFNAQSGAVNAVVTDSKDASEKPSKSSPWPQPFL